MAQNTSHAVMAQRIEAHDSLDDFPTQPWATRALCEHVLQPPIASTRGRFVWEPACNRGHMAEPLREYFFGVMATDIHDYGYRYQEKTADFLFPGNVPAVQVDWIITNPPFRLAEQFILKALEIAEEGVAVIVRTSFLESVGRYANLFSTNPPSVIAQFTERVPMVKGRLTATGSTATAYCWLVWIKGRDGTRFVWIPPCRKKLERAGDYQ
jgi:hypothetical protein